MTSYLTIFTKICRGSQDSSQEDISLIINGGLDADLPENAGNSRTVLPLPPLRRQSILRPRAIRRRKAKFNYTDQPPGRPHRPQTTNPSLVVEELALSDERALSNTHPIGLARLPREEVKRNSRSRTPSGSSRRQGSQHGRKLGQRRSCCH